MGNVKITTIPVHVHTYDPLFVLFEIKFYSSDPLTEMQLKLQRCIFNIIVSG